MGRMSTLVLRVLRVCLSTEDVNISYCLNFWLHVVARNLPHQRHVVTGDILLPYMCCNSRHGPVATIYVLQHRESCNIG
jgi:hypothetical protein